jgi:hypothetical protein
MSLALFSNDQALGFGTAAHSAVVVLDDGTRLPVGFRRVHGSGRVAPRTPQRRIGVRYIHGEFSVALDALPGSAVKWVRETANRHQKRKRDSTPDYIVPKGHGLLPTRNHRGQIVDLRGRVITRTPREPVKVEKPRATIDLPRDFPVVVLPHTNDGARDLLQIGKPFVIVYGTGLLATRHPLGTIKEFVLIK